MLEKRSVDQTHIRSENTIEAPEEHSVIGNDKQDSALDLQNKAGEQDLDDGLVDELTSENKPEKNSILEELGIELDENEKDESEEYEGDKERGSDSEAIESKEVPEEETEEFDTSTKVINDRPSEHQVLEDLEPSMPVQMQQTHSTMPDVELEQPIFSSEVLSQPPSSLAGDLPQASAVLDSGLKSKALDFGNTSSDMDTIMESVPKSAATVTSVEQETEHLESTHVEVSTPPLTSSVPRPADPSSPRHRANASETGGSPTLPSDPTVMHFQNRAAHKNKYSDELPVDIHTQLRHDLPGDPRFHQPLDHIDKLLSAARDDKHTLDKNNAPDAAKFTHPPPAEDFHTYPAPTADEPLEETEDAPSVYFANLRDDEVHVSQTNIDTKGSMTDTIGDGDSIASQADGDGAHTNRNNNDKDLNENVDITGKTGNGSESAAIDDGEEDEGEDDDEDDEGFGDDDELDDELDDMIDDEDDDAIIEVEGEMETIGENDSTREAEKEPKDKLYSAPKEGQEPNEGAEAAKEHAPKNPIEEVKTTHQDSVEKKLTTDKESEEKNSKDVKTDFKKSEEIKLTDSQTSSDDKLTRDKAEERVTYSPDRTDKSVPQESTQDKEKPLGSEWAKKIEEEKATSSSAPSIQASAIKSDEEEPTEIINDGTTTLIFDGTTVIDYDNVPSSVHLEPSEHVMSPVHVEATPVMPSHLYSSVVAVSPEDVQVTPTATSSPGTTTHAEVQNNTATLKGTGFVVVLAQQL